MISYSTTETREIIAIHVYWFCTKNGRKLPTRQQHWRYYLIDDTGNIDDLAVPVEMLRYCEYDADLCVQVADSHGIFIDSSQVASCWPALGSRWRKGGK